MTRRVLFRSAVIRGPKCRLAVYLDQFDQDES